MPATTRPGPVPNGAVPPAADPPRVPAKPRRRRRLNPLVADAKRLAQLLGLGVRTIRSMDYSGQLPRPIKLGSRMVWIITEIHRWLAAAKNGIPPDRRQWELMRDQRKGRPQ
jgi:predicted DNA-binding transcriptional regulator AlpA